MPFTSSCLSTGALSFFFRQLGSLVGSGVPLVRAWQLLAGEMTGWRRRRLQLAALQMEQGISPSLAMTRSQVFPALACRIIRAGEQTGNLEVLCTILADFYEEAGKERRLLVQALAYPCFLLVCLLCVVAGTLIFIVPVFTDMMVQMAVPLPQGTQYLLAVLHGLQVWGPYGLLFFLAASVFLAKAWQHDAWRLSLERQAVRLPGVRAWFLVWTWQRFSRILSVQLASGMPLLDCLPEAAAVVPSLLFRQYVQQARLFLERGQSFSQAVRVSRFSTAYVETMLSVAEMTGKYDEALSTIAVYYGDCLQQWAARLQRWLGPAVLLLTGVLMGTLLICLLLPLLDMASSAAM